MLKRLFLPILLGISSGIYAASGAHIEYINQTTNKEGIFNTNGIAAFLRKSQTLKKLDPDFSIVKGQHITQMHQEAKDAPYGTAQLFKYTNRKGKAYIIKEIKSSAGDGPVNEMNRLHRAGTSERLKQWVYPNKKAGHPQFIFPNAYLSYKDNHNKRHYIVVMPAARGKTLMQYMKEFKTRSNNQAFCKEIKQAFFSVGQNMARFYEHHRRIRSDNSAIIHGDFHMGNICYDKQTHHVTLIDNERVCKSFNACKSRQEDIAFLCLKSMLVRKWNQSDFFKNFDKRTWYNLFLTSFINGYLSHYKKEQRNVEYKKLREWIQSYTDENKKKLYTCNDLGFKHQNYMNPIFNKLATSISTQSAQKYTSSSSHSSSSSNSKTNNDTLDRAIQQSLNEYYNPTCQTAPTRTSYTINHLFDTFDTFNPNESNAYKILNSNGKLANKTKGDIKPLNFIASMGPAFFNTQNEKTLLNIAQMLISVGADINSKDSTGKTPLMSAIETKKGAMVQLLLDNS